MKVSSFAGSLLLIVFVCGPTSGAVHQGGQQPATVRGAHPPSKAWTNFAALIDDYMKMRDRVRQELPDLTVTDKPAQYQAASDALARAVERAKPDATQGSFFSTDTAAEIRRRISEYGRQYDLTDVVTPDPEERSTSGKMNVYTRFPMSSPMATMPPGLLAQLPPLPRALEYRLVGRMLILRDADAALVLDYLPDAVRLK